MTQCSRMTDFLNDLAAEANFRNAKVKVTPVTGRSHKPRNLAKSVTVE